MEFDLKQDNGAIVDIEFMVQYAVLGWASKYPVLGCWTGVTRLLDELMYKGGLSEAGTDALQRVYLAFRAAIRHVWPGLEIAFGRTHGYLT